MEYLQYPIIEHSRLHLDAVLNLVISGIPSIPPFITLAAALPEVLNLVISGIPSILGYKGIKKFKGKVLNLVISGIPSIPVPPLSAIRRSIAVLNLVISGIPSILKKGYVEANKKHSFKPCYKWNTFNTLDFDKNTDFMVS